MATPRKQYKYFVLGRDNSCYSAQWRRRDQVETEGKLWLGASISANEREDLFRVAAVLHSVG
jgi:hypothetical protein